MEPASPHPHAPPQLQISNRQRSAKINRPLLRQIANCVLTGLFGRSPGEVAVHLITSNAMAQLNERFLNHPGPTDVITFNYEPDPRMVSGEIFVCVEVARAQAARYGVKWGEELARYVVHGLLHLAGEDDAQPRPRRAMKRKENLWMIRLGRRFPLSKLCVGSRLSPPSRRSGLATGGKRKH